MSYNPFAVKIEEQLNGYIPQKGCKLTYVSFSGTHQLLWVNYFLFFSKKWEK